MERLLLVLDELDDVVGVARHLWLGVSRDFSRILAWSVLAVAPGLVLVITQI